MTIDTYTLARRICQMIRDDVRHSYHWLSGRDPSGAAESAAHKVERMIREAIDAHEKDVVR